jgi:magnesium chelatase subunit H
MPHNAPYRFVIVTLDNHLAGAVERAAAALARDKVPVEISFHAASDWDRNPDSLTRCIADIETADIVVATMLFLDDHIRAVLPTLEARRETCDAMLGLMSGAEVVRLTKMGGYRMDAPAKGPLALLKRLRGSSKPGQGGKSSGAGQMKMLRRLPKILRFIPGTAQDVRAYFLTLQYWLSGSDDNVVGMIRALIDRYATTSLKGQLRAEAPANYPDVGLYHPTVRGQIFEDAKSLPAKGTRGTVGLLMLRSYLLGKDTGHYDGVIAALEAKGLRVVPAFASGLDARPAIDKYFGAVDAIVSLTGFSLVGGPAYNDTAAAEEALAARDVPYISAHPLEFQTLQAWGASTAGLLPLEATMMVAIPELDGATNPMVFGGRSDGSDTACTGCARSCVFQTKTSARAMHPCTERAEALANKVTKLIALRHRARNDRKLALVLFNFPPNAGAIGTAAHMAVFESALVMLRRLADEGYDVVVPASVDALRDAVLKGNADRYGSDANVAALISADDHVRAEPHLRAIEAQWGPAPGKQQASGGNIHILGAYFGKVFVGVQPAFGYEGDPMRLLFEGGFAPTHAFSAFYRWLRQDFAADAVLHFGTHGALEFMPGKQTGLSGDCWPERLIDDLPNFYLYAANNPSEGLLAKRRSGATLISYLTPAVAEAGLYKGLSDLKALVDRWRMAANDEDRAIAAPMIAEAASALDLDASDMQALIAKLYEYERALIPEGLHELGEDELAGVIHALDGGYIRPSPGGDVLRNPDVLPTGRNIHGFDPFKLPSAIAVREGARAADALLAAHARTPETVAMVLWGTDNLKSEGAQIAQALALMGARPRHDGYGRLAGAELIPLGALHNPRIDVIATLSGIFRDLLPLQTRMLAEAALLAAQADEPVEQNFIRKHALAYVAAHGGSIETAALRVFSNAQGAYGANVNQLIDSGAWADPDELATMFETHKGYAYGVTGAPEKQSEVLKSALSTVDFAYQNLDSVELGVTTVDQYVDTLGGISRAVARAKGGEITPVYIVDATQGGAKVRTLAEQVDLETRTRILNPKWHDAMLSHGFEGVRHIEAGITCLSGWSATTGQVAPALYQAISETYLLDDAMRERMAALNPKATARVAGRLLEASDRQYWTPDAATLAALHAASDAIEDRLEGIAA